MAKLLENYTLGEVQFICRKTNRCDQCPFDQVLGCCDDDTADRPINWKIWHDSSIADAKAIMRVFPGAETVLRTEKGLIVHTPEHDFVVNTGLLSDLPVDEIAVLKEIVGADK